MKSKILASILIIISVAMITGGTMAWFTAEDSAGNAIFTAGTVKIEAGSKINIEDCVPSDEYVSPKRVVSYAQGSAATGENHATYIDVNPLRSNPDAVLTLGTGQSDSNFFSLGFGGWIILEFEETLSAGATLRIVEDTWGAPYPLETAAISVSSDGATWYFAGTADNTNLQNNQTYSEIGVPQDVTSIKYVKVVDTTDIGSFSSYEGTIDAFDLNTVMIRGSSCVVKNWNPGDCNERTFTVKNTGTKRIHVRAEFAGIWDGGLSISNVDIKLPADSMWFYQAGYFYYRGELLPGESAELTIIICLDGPGTGNEYQGKTFSLNGSMHAIQASNGASLFEWNVTIP